MNLAALLDGLGPFGAGLLSAASPCLLPLYPGFIAYLGSNARALEGRRATGLLGLLVLAGVLTTMTGVGVVLAAAAVPTSRLLAYATPVVDGLLILLGVLLLAGRNPFERLPGMRVPVVANPYRQAYVYGIMLGPIALPCAGPFLVSLLGISIGIADAAGKVGTFLVFGLGFGLPLVVLSLLAGTRSREIVGWIVARHRVVEIVAGLLLIVVAIVDLIDKWDSIRLTLGIAAAG
ncbi:MAG TPA: cytochrome c biogenesis protein CcdA [Candidatus Limnocylindrales bacterium]|nr:cytochrome c biogenesis protein CcdA [Candidatus Limnocylindrales bacterium]